MASRPNEKNRPADNDHDRDGSDDKQNGGRSLRPLQRTDVLLFLSGKRLRVRTTTYTRRYVHGPLSFKMQRRLDVHA